jgi:hypothetical protein
MAGLFLEVGHGSLFPNLQLLTICAHLLVSLTSRLSGFREVLISNMNPQVGNPDKFFRDFPPSPMKMLMQYFKSAMTTSTYLLTYLLTYYMVQDII